MTADIIRFGLKKRDKISDNIGLDISVLHYSNGVFSEPSLHIG